jgi:ionotropic glutamate receptor
MEKLIKHFDSKTKPITLRQLKVEKDDPTNFRPILTRVKSELDTNIIVSCSIEILPEVLLQAQQVGIMTENHQYIITTLDMHTLDLYPFQHGGTNITGLE